MNRKLKIAGIAAAGVLAVAAGGIAIAGQDRGFGPFGAADANNDGYISRDEWLKAANARFDALDRNKDGKLAIGEVPPPRPPHGPGFGPGRHGGPGGPDGRWRDAPPPPPGDDADDMAPPPGNAAAPQ